MHVDFNQGFEINNKKKSEDNIGISLLSFEIDFSILFYFVLLHWLMTCSIRSACTASQYTR